jgi:hypothetical protein
MRVVSFLLGCLLFLSACGLNASQEKSLNTAVSKYLFSVNSDLKLSRASYTHPSVLKYYKKKGHDEFKNFFLKEEMIWTDAVIGKIKSKGNFVQVEMKIALKKDDYSSPEKKRYSIYALSDDNGSTWFFVEEKDYKNRLCGNFQRLIK